MCLFLGKVRIQSSCERLHWEPVKLKLLTAELWDCKQEHPGLPLLYPTPVCFSFCKGAAGPEGCSAASECDKRNGLGIAGGVVKVQRLQGVLLSVSICQSAAEPSLALERSLRELGLASAWEIILGLYNLIWLQEVKSLAFSSCGAGLPLHGNGFDSEASLRSPLLAPASHSVPWLGNYSCFSGSGKSGHWTDLS